MSRVKLVVIGGVAAGMSAASRARGRNPELDITVLEKGRHVSYGACGLPYYLSGEVRDANDLVVYTPQYFREKRNIDIRLEHEATTIEPGRKLIQTKAPGARTIEIPYDKLVVATGGTCSSKLPGADLPGVFTCSDLDGAIRLRTFLEEKRPSRGVVVGSGYIGLEMATAFSQRGIAVTLLTRSAELLNGFEPEISKRLEALLQAHGAVLKKNTPVTAISSSPADGLCAHHARGIEAAGVMLLATGITPNTALVESAGISVGATGAIIVDDRMQTNVNGIYAAGDCVEARHLVSGRPVYFPLGTTANKQGRVAGENAAGGNDRFDGIVGTLATKVFELELARTGLSLAEAHEAGFDADSVTIHTVSRAAYLGGRPLIATIVWDMESGRLLGFQVAGEEGAAKRIDAAAIALHARMRIQDMLHLDLCYAPPFATVWEALLLAAGQAVKKSRRR